MCGVIKLKVARRLKEALINPLPSEMFARWRIVPPIRSMGHFSFLRVRCVSVVRNSGVHTSGYEKNAELSRRISESVCGYLPTFQKVPEQQR